MALEKAWDLKGLALALKPHGLELGEEAAKALVDCTLCWIEESVKLSENQIDDFALVVIPLIKPMVLSQLDKIDGK